MTKPDTLSAIKTTVQTFIDRYLPQHTDEAATAKLTPRTLLFDTGGVFKDITFTSAELQDCITDYVMMIPPLLADMQGKPHVYLTRIRHDDASELLLAYLYRAKADNGFEAMVAYIREADVVGQIKTLMDAVDPERKGLTDGIRHIAAIGRMLQSLRDGQSTGTD